MPAYINPFQGRKLAQATAYPVQAEEPDYRAEYDSMMNTPSRQAYQDALSERPEYEAPTFGRRLAASLAGAFESLSGRNGVATTQRLLDDPYNTRTREWQKKVTDLKQLADLDEEGLRNKLKFESDRKTMAINQDKSKLEREKFGEEQKENILDHQDKSRGFDIQEKDLQERAASRAVNDKQGWANIGLRGREANLREREYNEGAGERKAKLANIEADTAMKGRSKTGTARSSATPERIDRARTLALEELSSKVPGLKDFIVKSKAGSTKGRPVTLNGESGSLWWKKQLDPRVWDQVERKVDEILERESSGPTVQWDK